MYTTDENKENAGKTVIIAGEMHYYSITIDGKTYNVLDDGFSKLQSKIIPTRSTLINPGTYVLDKNGKLPRSANDKMIKDWDDDGNRTIGKNTL